MRVGYGRVSTDKETQKFDRQEDQLKDAGCEKIYLERMSGRKKDRPMLNLMLEELIGCEDEVKQVVCVSLDRIGRSTKNVLELIETLDENGIELISLKEGSLLTKEDHGQSKFLLVILSAVAELEANMCRARTIDGLKAAKRRGKTLGRPRVDPDKMNTAIRMYMSRDYSVAEVCSIAQISKQTLYNELKRRGVSRD